MPTPIYKVFNGEIGSFVHRFIHDETKGQIEAALECYAFPRGFSELLMEDGSAEDEARLMEQWEDLRPLQKRTLSLIR